MKFILHLYQPKPTEKAPAKIPRLKVAMTQFQMSPGGSVVTVTFGSDFEVKDVACFSRVGEGSEGLAGLAQLLLESKRPDRSSCLDDTSRYQLQDLLSRKQASHKQGTTHWLQAIFGCEAGTLVPNDLLRMSKDSSVEGGPKLIEIGPGLSEAGLEVYLHTTTSSVLAAAASSVGTTTGRGSRSADDKVFKEPETWPGLAEQFRSELKVIARFEVNKRNRGIWIDPETSEGLLPVTSLDHFRLLLTTGTKAHYYVILVDNSGQTIPFWPWTPQQWSDETAVERNTTRTGLNLPDDLWSLPAEGDRLRAFGEPGAETFCVIVSREKQDLKTVEQLFKAWHNDESRPNRIHPRNQSQIEREQIVRRVAVCQPKNGRNRTVGFVRSNDDALTKLRTFLETKTNFDSDDFQIVILPSKGGPSE